jgi:glucose/arabinose dehydrogenase
MDPQDASGQSTPGGHIGGAIHFGLDRKLYIATGDLTAGSPAQSMGSLFGKILRIHPDGSIPADNPFYGSATGKYRAIWALGLRNPFTFAVQPGTGRIFANDVGGGSWEEIDEIVRGGNYGWPATEGATTNPSYRSPFHAYDHSSGCSINGGVFYTPAPPPTGWKALLFTKTAGFRHASIPSGIAAIQQLASQNGFAVDATEDATRFTTANLAQYRAVVFLSTSDDVLNATQEAAFQSYLRSGGGFAAIHQGVTTEQGWPWFVNLVGGGKFASHPAVQSATCDVENPSHLSTAGLPSPWSRSDEWYNLDRNPRPNTNVLVTVRESSYSGGTMGSDHPVSWFHGFEGGRVWCTLMGHSDAHYDDANFRKHLLGGIQYAAGVTPGVQASQPFPASYANKYFFADFCGNWIKTIDPATKAVATFATGLEAPIDLDLAPDGSLYVLLRNTAVTGGNQSASGQVARVRYTGSQAPVISSPPQSLTVPVGQPATFSVAAGGTAPLSYQWQRNGANIAGATSSSYTLASAALADSGATFRCVVTNAYGSATSAAATLTVTSNQAPAAAITAPAAGATYRAGDLISYAGTGTDPEDGSLPASAFTWSVDFHHGTHSHPFLPPASGAKSGSFTIPTGGETSDDVWYRLHLTVRDSGGLTHSVFRDLLPVKSTFTLQTSPAGLQVTLDAQPRTTPLTVTGVVGLARTLGVVSPQTSAGKTWVFASWSDGGAATHAISTPESPTTYTATFAESAPPAGGTGLAAEYFDNPDFTAFRLARTDPKVDFDWATGSPHPELGPDGFSVRWTGFVIPEFSQTYSFYTMSDDGVRLRVNGQLLVDNWTDHGPTENSGAIALSAGVPASLVLEYYENTGGARIGLSWSSASRPKEVVPASRLAIADADGDGLSDAAESAFGLDPGDPDQDGNGVPDGRDDWDRNGVSNADQAAAGGNPGSVPAPGAGGSCGALGAEALILLALRRRIRR